MKSIEKRDLSSLKAVRTKLSQMKSEFDLAQVVVKQERVHTDQVSRGVNAKRIVGIGFHVAMDARSYPGMDSTIGVLPTHAHSGTERSTTAAGTKAFFTRHDPRLPGDCDRSAS